jgi:hypothetical protein
MKKPTSVEDKKMPCFMKLLAKKLIRRNGLHAIFYDQSKRLTRMFVIGEAWPDAGPQQPQKGPESGAGRKVLYRKKRRRRARSRPLV